MPEAEWIFFDCFNTLLDDFDPAGHESGLGPLPELAAELGFFPSPTEFVHAYQRERSNFSGGDREVLLDDRLRRTLAAGGLRDAAVSLDDAVMRLLARWEPAYRRLVRPTPGVEEMLAHWSARKPLGVVSNFYLAGFPERLLREFGLFAHFRFVIDSATFGFRKPSRMFFAEALSRAGLSEERAHQVLFVGDNLQLDVLAARQTGMRVLHFNRFRTRPSAPGTPPGIDAIFDWSDFR